MSLGRQSGNLLLPDWPAQERVRSCITTRAGGVSQVPFETFNLGDHVDDQPQAVAENRRRLNLKLDCVPAWLQQVHGVKVVEAVPQQVLEADASWTSTPGVASVVMTADCLPVLFCDRSATRVAAAHAGWRRLVAGVLEETVHGLALPGDELAWLGPAIGPQSFEVGAEVREAFLDAHEQAAIAFIPQFRPGPIPGGYLPAGTYASGCLRCHCGVRWWRLYLYGSALLLLPSYAAYRALCQSYLAGRLIHINAVRLESRKITLI